MPDGRGAHAEARPGLARAVGCLALTGSLLASAALGDPCRDRAENLRAGVLRAAVYPNRSTARLALDLSAVPEPRDWSAVAVVLAARGAGAPTATFPLPRAEAIRPGGVERLVRLPELPDGDWELRARLETADCPPSVGPVAAFRMQRFGWEHNHIGEEPRVIPPFTPLAVRGSHVLSVLRDHEVGPDGLWAQVVSAGAPLLAGPMRFDAIVDGVARQASARAPQLVRTRDDRVEVAATTTLGPLQLVLRGAFEVDGLYRLKLGIAAQSRVSVERLDLVIPLRPEAATLMNAITDETRYHRLGAVPAGSGTVWRSTNAPHTQLDAGFVPYLWVGNEERGIAWLAESTRGFWFLPGTALTEIRRRPDRVELVVHLAAVRGDLDRPRSLTFALQATPAKPRPDGPKPWRTWQLACDAGPDFVSLCLLPAGLYWGAETRFASVAPRGGDYQVPRWIAAARRGGTGRPPIESWLDRHGVNPRDRDESIASIGYALRAAQASPTAMLAYFNAQGAAWGPEFAVYSDEWRSAPFGDREGRDEPPLREIQILPRESYADFLVWNVQKLLETGAVDGVFLDNSFLRASFDDFAGTAWRDSAGRLHPGVEIYALRALTRRLQTLVWNQRKQWWTASHLTSTPISAVHSFAGVSVDGEMRYGADDYALRFPRDAVRASALGTQLGTVPAWLPGITGASAERSRELLRQLFGFAGVHELKAMVSFDGEFGTLARQLQQQGYGDPHCSVVRYWDANPRVKVSGGDVASLTIACPGRTTVLVASFDLGGLTRLSSADASSFRCTDLERRGSVAQRANGCELFLEPYGVRLLELKPVEAR
jgi:hypothetical protein